MPRRFVLNCLFAVLVAAFYFVASSVLNLIASTESHEDHVYTFAKRKADQHSQRQEWKPASRYYKQLAESDPLNAGAHVSYAFGLTKQMEVLMKRSASANPTTKAALEAEINLLMNDALFAYQETLPFKKFRNFSRYQIALINGYQGDYETSKEFIAMALRDGLVTRDLYSRFKLYRCLDEVYRDPEITRLFKRNF